jgi:arylsulfatase A-like enzyme
MGMKWNVWNRGKSLEDSLTSASIKTPTDTDQLDRAEVPNPWHRPWSMVLLTVWFGLVGGGLEALSVAILHWLGLCLLDVVSPYLWVIPISQALIYAIPGIALCLLKRFRVISSLLGVITFLLSFVTFGNLVLAIGAMERARPSLLATILLTAGVATQARHFIIKHPLGFHRLVLRTTPAFILMIGMVAVGTLGTDALNRWNMARSIPSASANAPNVLFIVLDTVRAKSMSLYGYGRPTTPNIEKWARLGIVFDRAISPAPWTLTSHASMFTGRYPQELTADWNVPLDRKRPTLAEAFYSHGYMTAGFVSNTFSCGRQTGLDRGFVQYEAHTLSLLEFLVRASLPRKLFHLPTSTSVEATGINESFLGFLSHSKVRPFFVFLNYLDCHAPYFPASSVDEQGSGLSKDEKNKLLQWLGESIVTPDAEGLELAHQAYENSLVRLDYSIGLLLTELEKRGERERTLVIIVGDHGEQFGEHGLVQHGDSLYRPNLHVPLVIIDPRSSRVGQHVDEMVSLRDLPATILELLGLPKSNIPGDSFAGLINGRSASKLALEAPKYAFVSKMSNLPEWHPNHSGPVEAVFADGKYYIKSHQKEELYDFYNDPEEQWNLAGSEANGALLQHYRELLSSTKFPE